MSARDDAGGSNRDARGGRREDDKHLIAQSGESAVIIGNVTGPIHVGSGDQINVIYRRD